MGFPNGGSGTFKEAIKIMFSYYTSIPLTPSVTADIYQLIMLDILANPQYPIHKTLTTSDIELIFQSGSANTVTGSVSDRERTERLVDLLYSISLGGVPNDSIAGDLDFYFF